MNYLQSLNLRVIKKKKKHAESDYFHSIGRYRKYKVFVRHLV